MSCRLNIFTASFLMIVFCGFLQIVKAAPGDLDTSFSFDGFAGVQVGGGADDSNYAIAVQPDGKIVVAGTAEYLYTDRCSITRYNADGTLDTSFSGDGRFYFDGGEYTTICRSVAIQPDGKIVAAGTVDPFSGSFSSGILVRLNADGTLDTTFDGDGWLKFLNFRFNTVAIQTDGKILAAGNAFSGANNNFPIIRYNPNGSPDALFVPNGVLAGHINSVAVQSDGKIVAGGFATNSNADFLVARLNSNGQFDASFDVDGKVTTDISLTDIVNSVAVQTDGKIVAVGYSGGTERFAAARYNTNGTLDTSFDGDGIVTTVFSNASFAYGVMVQPDGKIISSGASSNGTVVTFTLVRYNSNGSLDTSFDGDGKVTTIVSDFTSRVYGATLLADGKILTAGYARHGTSLGNYNDNSIIARYNADGSPDVSFDGDGILESDLAVPVSAAYDTAIQADGKIIAAGYSTSLQGYKTDFTLARFNTDGSVDATFDGDGKLTTTIGTGYNFAEAVTVQADGKIVAAGWSNNQGTGDYDITLVRYNADGSLDTSFDGDGKVTTNITQTNQDEAKDVLIQPDGKILVAGSTHSSSGSENGVFVRYNADGSLDTTFDGDGILITPVFELHSVKVQPDGKIVGAGFRINGANNDFAVVRYNANGTPDASFINGGIAYYPVLNSQDYAYDVALQTDGKIVVSGRTFNGSQDIIGVIRINPDSTLDTSFDGDGKATVAVASNGYTSDLAIQTDGKIVVAGGQLVRFNTDGSLDTAYGTNGVSTVYGSGINLDSNDRAIVTRGTDDAFFGVARVLSATALIRAPFDFDGDGKTDIAIFRPGGGEWWINQSSNGVTAVGQFGVSTDKIVPGDYTGDGKTDLAVWRPGSGEWFILRSENNSYFSVPFGTNGDIPAPADFDADGKTDIAIFRPSSGLWYINKSTGGTSVVNFGQAGDVPVIGDYDRDGQADIAVWRAANSTWWILKSSTSTAMIYQFGNSTDIPVQGDYTGDGRTDSALWRPSTGEWYILRSEDQRSFYAFPFGTSGDIPAPGDYDGDGKFDATVFRPSNAAWYSNRSTAGLLVVGFGFATDRPVPNAFIP